MNEISEVPVEARTRQSNGFGLAGFIVSLFGLIGGCVSPISLILSLIGVTKRPRGFAVAGLLISLIGLAQLTGIVILVVTLGQKVGSWDFQEWSAHIMLWGLDEAVAAYHQEHSAYPPADGLAQALTQGQQETVSGPITDPWGTAIEYTLQGDSYVLRSAGADGTFGTADDIVYPEAARAPESSGGTNEGAGN